jgi:hypothetical protein
MAGLPRGSQFNLMLRVDSTRPGGDAPEFRYPVVGIKIALFPRLFRPR